MHHENGTIIQIPLSVVVWVETVAALFLLGIIDCPVSLAASTPENHVSFDFNWL